MRFTNSFTEKYQSEILGREGSQHGEEGILIEIFKRLSITSGWAVDVGAWDGKCFNNIFHLVKTGNYKAIEIEADPLRFKGLENNTKDYPNMTIINSKVELEGEKSLNNILKTTSIPQNFEILNIDIDSYDYQVWEGLDYNPIVVIVEFNPRFQDTEHINDKEYNLEDHASYGSSFMSFIKLGEKKGYTFVCTCGCNMIFVKNYNFGLLDLDKNKLLQECLVK